MKICVISDLHMYCRRSRWRELAPAIDAAAGRAEVFVFNGDTLDFKWTQLAGAKATAAAGEAYLRAFAERHAHCRVHVNLGNHDHHRLFIAALERLAPAYENFTWSPYHCRIGDAVFLHGDIAHWGMNQTRLESYRAGWLDKPRAGERLNRVHDAAFRLRVHRLLPRLVFPEGSTLRRIAMHLDAIGHGPANGVRRVFYGHTHRPVSGAAHGGLLFYNGGTALRGIPFEVLEAHV